MEAKYRLIAIRIPDGLPETEPLVIVQQATFDQAREVIKKCAEKFALYRNQHSGEYVGGMEYSALIREVNNVLAAMEATS